MKVQAVVEALVHQTNKVFASDRHLLHEDLRFKIAQGGFEFRCRVCHPNGVTRTTPGDQRAMAPQPFLAARAFLAAGSDRIFSRIAREAQDTQIGGPNILCDRAILADQVLSGGHFDRGMHSDAPSQGIEITVCGI